MSLKARYFVGAALSAATVGGAVFFDAVGRAERPEPLVVQFSRGASLATDERARIDSFIGRHIGEPRVRLHVLGHTGDRGDDDANAELSRERAAIVAKLIEDAGFDADRIVSIGGVGGASPPARLDGESDGAFQRRMARVVITPFISK